MQYLLVAVPSALANCNDRIASLDLVQPIMEHLWQQLQEQNRYAWGSEPVYGKLVGDSITLTPAFERLTGAEKKQVLDQLRLEYDNNWFDLLTSKEQTEALKHPGFGALSPYRVYASDGRIISVPYDGCTRMTLLTEKARFSYYFHTLIYRGRISDGKSPVTLKMLRNAGQPSWRKVKLSISEEEEELIRLRFWETVGYDRANMGWWIAWVPEQGYFEINVPMDEVKNYRLEQFLQAGLHKYRYVVVTTDGTLFQMS